MARSAVSSVRTPGVLVTMIPRATAASMSIWSTPAPKLAIIFNWSPAPLIRSASMTSVMVGTRTSARWTAACRAARSIGWSFRFSSASKSSRIRVSTASGRRLVNTTLSLRADILGLGLRAAVLRDESPRDGSFHPVSSKAAAIFQSLRRRMVAVLALMGLAVMAGAGATMPDGPPTPTGLEVPRWISLKSSHVRARQGPGLDYPILWEYRAAGLPVQVIAETSEWRKICDPDGAVAWIHRTVSSGRRYVFNTTAEEIPIRSGRSETASVRARLSPRALIALDECEDGWCKVRARRMQGWAPQRAVFGTQERALCNANRPAGTGRS